MIRAFTALAFLLPSLAFAQLSLNVNEPLSVSIAPANPRPGGVVTVKPASTQVDFANSTMTVAVEGKEVYRGNTTPTPVQLNGIGQKTTIKVTVTGGGQTLSKTISLMPSDVSLVVEPIASAPALYPGRPLLPVNSNVRLVAVADFRTSPTTRIDPDLLSYKWSVDGSNLVSASGIGKTSIVLPAPLEYRTQTVSVVVQNRTNTLMGGDSFTLTSQNPTLRLYVNDPLQGILFDHALASNYRIKGSEATLVAIPYAYPGKAPEVQWFLNGGAAESGSAITLRPQGAGQGGASLTATARSNNSNNTISASLSILFGSASNNIFGL
jgi:hypothetical protein